MAEFRAEAERRGARPKSWAGAITVILIWAAVAALLMLWLWPEPAA
jgi:hypothetical protein